MKKIMKIGLIFIAAVVLISNVSAVIVHPPTNYVSGNETYMIVQTMDFNKIVIDSDYMQFNQIRFYVDAPNNINIPLLYVCDDLQQTNNGSIILEFLAYTSSGNVYFNLSGLTISNYIVSKDSSTFYVGYSNGVLLNSSFNNNVWNDEYHFRIKKMSRYDVNIDSYVDAFDMGDTWNQRNGQQPYNGLFDVDFDLSIGVFDLNKIWSERS